MNKIVKLGLMLAVLLHSTSGFSAVAVKKSPSSTVEPEKNLSVLLPSERAQIERLTKLMKKTNEQIKSRLSKLPQKRSMEAALLRIKSAESSKETKALVTAYEKRYQPIYAEVMKRSNVSPAFVLAEARRIAPDLDVKLVQGFGIQAMPKRLRRIPTKSVSSKSAHTEYPPEAQTQRIVDFETQRKISAGAAAGGGVNFGEDYVKAHSIAILAGIVFAEGSLKKQIDISTSVRKAIIRVKGTILVEALSVGLGIDTVFAASADVSIARPDQSADIDVGVFVITMAPLLWVSFALEENSFDRSQAYRAGNRLEFIGRVSARGAAFLSPESHGRSELTDLVVELTTIQ